MKYALIKNSIVENVIEADGDFVTLIADEWDHIEPLDTPHEQGLGVGIGWGYDDATGTFTDPTPPVMPVAALAALDLDACVRTYAYTNGLLTTDTATDGSNTWVKTYSYTAGVLTGETKWVRQ